MLELICFVWSFLALWAMTQSSPHPSHPSQRIPQAMIHIGPYKTGSTSFQTFLFSHQKYFELNSFYLLGNCTKAHRIISERVKGFNELDALQQKVSYKDCSISYKDLDTFLTLSSQHSSPSSSLHNIIFSSEEFSSLNSQNILSLQRMFSGYEVKIILVYRLWIQLIYSYFNQHSKSFRGNPFFESYLNENSAAMTSQTLTDQTSVLVSSFSSDLIQQIQSFSQTAIH
jgi:hypothetical protein